MKIQAEIRGDMVGFSLKHNPENGTRYANVSVAVSCDRDRTAELFGAELANLAFSAVTQPDDKDGAAVSLGYKKLQPSAICEMHHVKICGHGPISAQPEIVSLVPVKDDEKITATIKIPILIKKDSKLAGDLAIHFGEVIDVEFNPSQQSLNLVDGGSSQAQGVVTQRGPFGNPKPVETGA